MEKLSKDLLVNLKTYLNDDEEIVDAIKEVFIFKFDFRWIVLTNQKVIISAKKFLDYSFKDFTCARLDIDLDLGFIFDVIEFEIPGKRYQAQFYSWHREDTKRFFNRSKVCVSGQYRQGPNRNPDNLENPIYLLHETMKLRDEGVITQKEYEKKKKELLKRL